MTIFKKTLYGFGGVLAFLVVLSSFLPAQEKAKQESVSVATTSTPVTAAGEETKQIVEQKQQTTVVISQPKEVAPVQQYTYYQVTNVVDGDTLKVSINGSIETLRLIGMDTPETVDPRKPVQCFGKEASNMAKELLLGKKVRLEKDPSQGDRDKYGRTLAYIYLESGLFYNRYMIEQGYAYEYTYNTPYKYQTEFKQAQKTAEQNQVGLWSPSTCSGNASQSSSSTAQSSVKYYTSSAGSKYYPESCSAWQSLSKANLRVFNSLEELLVAYPKRTLAETCK